MRRRVLEQFYRPVGKSLSAAPAHSFENKAGMYLQLRWNAGNGPVDTAGAAHQHQAGLRQMLLVAAHASHLAPRCVNTLVPDKPI